MGAAGMGSRCPEGAQSIPQWVTPAGLHFQVQNKPNSPSSDKLSDLKLCFSKTFSVKCKIITETWEQVQSSVNFHSLNTPGNQHPDQEHGHHPGVPPSPTPTPQGYPCASHHHLHGPHQSLSCMGSDGMYVCLACLAHAVFGRVLCV